MAKRAKRPVQNCPWNPAKAKAWQEHWQRVYAPQCVVRFGKYYPNERLDQARQKTAAERARENPTLIALAKLLGQ